jgi:type IV secretion system protein TrbL
MMLAVIVGIGTSLFAEMSQTPSSEPDIAQALSLVLASLALFGLGIFAPSLAAGLVAGAPQLGAGAALGTSLGAIGISAAGGAATMTVARATGSAALGAIHAGASMGTAASLAYQLGQSGAGAGSKAAGLGGIARAASASVRHSLSARLGVGPASRAQRRAAAADRDHAAEGAQPTGDANPAPAWAQNLARQQTAQHRRQVVLQSLKEGDHGSMSATPDLKEKDE